MAYSHSTYVWLLSPPIPPHESCFQWMVTVSLFSLSASVSPFREPISTRFWRDTIKQQDVTFNNKTKAKTVELFWKNGCVKGEIVCLVKSLLLNSIAPAINLIFNLVTCELKKLENSVVLVFCTTAISSLRPDFNYFQLQLLWKNFLWNSWSTCGFCNC